MEYLKVTNITILLPITTLETLYLSGYLLAK